MLIPTLRSLARASSSGSSGSAAQQHATPAAAAAAAALRTLFASTLCSSSTSTSTSSSSSSSSNVATPTNNQLRAATHASASSSSSSSSSSTGLISTRTSLISSRPMSPASPWWHQLQQAAAYRAPVGKDAKTAKTKGKASKAGGAPGAAGADTASAADADSAGAGTAAAAMFTDDTPHAGDAVRVLLAAIDNVTPHLEVRTRRAATKTIFVPGAMPRGKARSLALHWLVRAAEARKKGARAPFSECLALEVLLAYQKRGAARQKRDELHKVALQNRANLHMRWW